MRVTDSVFVVEEDRILARRESRIREKRLEKLELRAMVEEVEAAEIRSLNERQVRRTSRNNHVYGTDEFHWSPRKGQNE
jgi:predicted RNase H-like nuclease